MINQVTRFSISGLHSAIDVDVPIEDGKVILVGVNGLGKTTIVSMLYYFLTRQWNRLLDYEFSSVSITIDQEVLMVDRETLVYPESGWQHALFEGVPSSVVDRLRTSRDFQLLIRTHLERPVRREDLTKIARKLELPFSFLERAYINAIRPIGGVSKKQRKTSKALQDIESKLSAIDAQILYLPTYRRIEQDLKSIFPELEGDFRKAVKSRVSRDTRAGFVELVEFGMEDVDERVQARVSALKDGSRVELNNLAGGYLRDVIRGEARQWSGEKIKVLSDREVKLILGRVEEKQLDELDKRKVFEVINLIRKDLPLAGDQHLLAHFFSKLVNIHESQQEAEIPVRQFIEVCNRYLQAKSFVFDDVNYELSLELVGGSTIEMRNLSSGEKQIVSLFAHIYLGDAASYFLIIDEPELSLSVEWQHTLLTDVIASNRCVFLAAVTHSPFIYDNELISYAKDLAELQSVRG